MVPGARLGAVIPGQRAVELVMQTATSLLAHRLAPREAVTILATQAPQALRRETPVLAPQRARLFQPLPPY